MQENNIPRAFSRCMKRYLSLDSVVAITPVGPTGTSSLSRPKHEGEEGHMHPNKLPSAVLTKYLCMPGRGDRLGAMKPPLYIRHITDEERAVLAAGLRSHDAFTVRRCQIVFASAEGQK